MTLVETGDNGNPSSYSAAGAAGTEHLKHNPRKDMIQAIRDNDAIRCLVKTAEIHGHFCPGIALGVMASLCGLRQPEVAFAPSDGMEDLMAVVEINACFADGVQAVSGCTLGNNSLVYRDLGRTAVTFVRRGEKKGVRVRVRPDFRSRIEQAVPGFYPLMEKVVINRDGSAEENAAFMEKGWEAALFLVQLPFEEILITETVRPVLPDYAPVTRSVVCPGCGETVMATKVVAEGEGRSLCFMCAGSPYREVEGQGIVVRESRKRPSPDVCGHRSGHGQSNRGRGPSSFRMHDSDFVFSELGLKEGESLLDMGCGAGDYTIQASGIVGNSGTVYALDKWEEMIKGVVEEAGFQGIRNIKAITSDITGPLPIRDDCADVCLIATVLHILDPEQDKKPLFSEIRRVLKPGGRVAIIECKKEVRPFGPPVHMCLSPEEVEKMVTRHGFERIGFTDLGYNYMIQYRSE
ncbi:hypothetical protein DENIS_0616 [Desulfonema ishimotonii]|uniref:Methyltransferase type 11 n=1 Tax=Desulfonema ishimotonii TaxID=45657 RepID=A0A401FRT9_9BACT|nr:FmdE family protein [Desulfonema ishimotonii]GBC59675.1 hypothetical protein DENIS_0616 [Desulfonema ishimotonii]